eukprot:m.204936 g.204936  ORF g.204936 m.204936 type:complete len:53 (+) comp32903_c5_seq15:1105-1263(+)
MVQHKQKGASEIMHASPDFDCAMIAIEELQIHVLDLTYDYEHLLACKRASYS